MAWPTFLSINSPSRPPGGGSALIAGQANVRTRGLLQKKYEQGSFS